MHHPSTPSIHHNNITTHSAHAPCPARRAVCCCSPRRPRARGTADAPAHSAPVPCSTTPPRPSTPPHPSPSLQQADRTTQTHTPHSPAQRAASCCSCSRPRARAQARAAAWPRWRAPPRAVTGGTCGRVVTRSTQRMAARLARPLHSREICLYPAHNRIIFYEFRLKYDVIARCLSG